MPVFLLNESYVFPSPHLADEDGLLAIGGDLSPYRLIEAYKKGIFPWYNDPPILWWSPHPRFVLFPEKLKISKSMKQVFKKGEFIFKTNTAFQEVIHSCRIAERKEDGTWISDEIEEAYVNLHNMGYALSAESWENEEIVGGLYGIKMGKVFFGESMFSLHTQASRYAFIKYTEQLKNEGVQLIDCQAHTSYIESMGAETNKREEFRKLQHTYICGWLNIRY